MASGNILGSGDKAVSPDRQSAPTPLQQKILQACKQQADQYANDLFKQVVDKLDDVLFERSNKSGADASVYIEAARELRLKRQEFTQSFLDKFTQTFKSRLTVTSSAASSGKKEYVQNSGLSLVDESELEESLAIDGLIAKANDRFRNELFALAQRFNKVMDVSRYTDEIQPLAPDTISYPFRDVFHGMGWTVEIKLITYKLFDKHMMQTLEAFYHQINESLSKSGILPELKLGAAIRASGGAAQDHSSKINDNQTQPSVAAHNFLDEGMQGAMRGGAQGGMPSGMQGASLSADVYQTLQQLMNVRKFGASADDYPVAGVNGGGDGVMSGSAMVMGSSLPADDLVRGLSLLQKTPLHLVSGETINIAAIKDALLEQMQQFGDGRGLHPAHDNTIDVIGMIFEFILDEPSIPDVVKNLLNRLQIPILKVAIVDKAFFTNKTHPARRLLNVLGHACIGWNDNSEDARERRFQKIEYVVTRVLAEFEQDPGIFAALLGEFTEFLANEGEGDGAEQGTALDDQAEDESPDRLAFETIEARLEGAEVPEILRSFLRSTWRDVLQHVLDSDGHNSDNWFRQEQTVEDLMWSVEPKASAEDRRKMVMLLPKLLNALRGGMALIGRSQQEMDSMIDALEPIHMACLHGESPLIEQGRTEQAKKEADTVEGSSNEVADMVRSIQEGMRQDGEHLAMESGIDDNIEDLDKDMTSSIAEYQEAADHENIEDEFTAAASEMKIGTWLEFSLDDKKRRGKLAWKSVVMGEYVFVDRKYKVVAERTLAGLASDLRHGVATLVEDVPMFDRALDRVLNGLMSSSQTAN